MASVAHSYMEEEGVWIIPKQNKIRVACKLEGELAHRIKGIQLYIFYIHNFYFIDIIVFSLHLNTRIIHLYTIILTH